MKITQILVNHMHEPIGFELKNLRIEFSLDLTEDIDLTKEITISTSNHKVYHSEEKYTNNYFLPQLDLSPRTRYQVKITVKSSDQTISAETFFETGKMNENYQADWIGNDDKSLASTLFEKGFKVKANLLKARLYATGLGLYEVYLDSSKIGNEYLAPGCTNYKEWIQVQTYDITQILTAKTNHKLSFMTADGWYKGNMGFDGGKDRIYGDHQRILAELHLTYDDGSEEIIKTDNTWKTACGPITKSAIYYGEDLNDTLIANNWSSAQILDYPKDILTDRLSLPLTIDEYLSVKNIIHTPKGETVLDFGQNHSGWVEFLNHQPQGKTLTIEVGEILQNGNFYRDNLRLARAAFKYTSNGEEKWIRPHFTYFGFRYARITGANYDIKPEDFRSAVIFSKMEQTGEIKTTNKLVNRLFNNVLWSQKSNFFDVPTDCPQRDERLGWTGDANIFSKTAALNMNVFEFFKKYARDMAIEQKKHDGMLTMYAPSMGDNDGGAAVWGDAATFLPWNMYQMYGDPAILIQNYTAMKDWVDWISKHTKLANTWTGCFQFGDWLALDGEDPALPTGKTDEDYIAGIYYYASSKIVAESAKLLGFTEDNKHYQEQAIKIKDALLKEYMTPNGRLAIDTQTAYALALYFKIIPKALEKRVINDLTNRLHKDNDHLKTGFIGTPFICQVLSEYGKHKLATKIFLNDDYPSWLYAVKLGATTVWERWNSVLENGKMNPQGMNSLNHYSIGAIKEWAYRYVLGIKQVEPGMKKLIFAPKFDYRLKQVSGYFKSTYGTVKVNYQIETDDLHTIKVRLDIPYGQSLKVVLPRSNEKIISLNQKQVASDNICLNCGHYEISYQPNRDYIERYSEKTPIGTIMEDPLLVNKIDGICSILNFFKDSNNIKNFAKMSLPKLNTLLPFINISPEDMSKIKVVLESTPLLSERN